MIQVRLLTREMEFLIDICFQVPVFKLHQSVIHHCQVFFSILVLSSLCLRGLSQAPTGGPPIGPLGYINIDCGGKDGKDPITGLDWITDEGFLYSGDPLATDGFALPVSVTLNDSVPTARNNGKQLETAMAFVAPEAKPRWHLSSTFYSEYCYKFNISLSNNYSTTYLVRAMFPSTNLSSISGENLDFASHRSSFSFAVDSTVVANVSLDRNEPLTVELIVTSISDSMDVCLLLESAPFGLTFGAISSLELSSQPQMFYPIIDVGKFVTSSNGSAGTLSHLQSLMYYATLYRLNFGGNDSSPAIRHPDDPFDRLWYGAPTDRGYQYGTLTPITTNTRSEFSSKSVDANTEVGFQGPAGVYIPSAILTSAWEGLALNSVISFTLDIQSGRRGPGDGYLRLSDPQSTNSLSLYFMDFDNQANNNRTVNIYNGDQAPGNGEVVAWTWILQDAFLPNFTMAYFYNMIYQFYTDSTVFNISRGESSNVPPLINGFELYANLNADSRTTSPDDVSRIRGFIRSVSPNTNISRESDPCKPIPWFWLRCTDSGITEIYLESYGLDGELTNDLPLPSGLQVLDLSNNSFHGNLPSSFKIFTSLNQLVLKQNGLLGVVPDEIWKPDSQLQIVDLSYNNFSDLNLTSWVQALWETVSARGNVRYKQVNLVNNSISSVVLGDNISSLISLPDFTLYSVLKASTGYILLGGNEWCQNSEPFKPVLIKRYLCRNSELEDYYQKYLFVDAASKRALIIGLAASGMVLLLVAIGLLVSLGRMVKRVKDLHQVQEELAKEDVKPPFYRYEELRAATKDFSKENLLGKGGFGAVYKAILADKSVVAVKLLFPTEQNVADFLKEMVLITGIKHRHLIQLRGCCVRGKKRILVYEYAENMNLAEALWGNDGSFKLTWAQRMNLCVGVAKGLAYLHEELHPSIIHRDIKPQNILLDKDWNAKIADFGLARLLQGDGATIATSIGGTVGYVSPEYASQGLLTEKLDVYSYGILLLEIISGRRCIDPSAPTDQYYLRTWALELHRAGCLSRMAEQSLLAAVPAEEIESVLKIALVCVQEVHSKRPSMGQVVYMLTGNAPNVAMDIIDELRNQHVLYEPPFEVSTISKYGDLEESESQDLRALSSRRDSNGYIELTIRKSR